MLGFDPIGYFPIAFAQRTDVTLSSAVGAAAFGAESVSNTAVLSSAVGAAAFGAESVSNTAVLSSAVGAAAFGAMTATGDEDESAVYTDVVVTVGIADVFTVNVGIADVFTVEVFP